MQLDLLLAHGVPRPLHEETDRASQLRWKDYLQFVTRHEPAFGAAARAAPGWFPQSTLVTHESDAKHAYDPHFPRTEDPRRHGLHPTATVCMFVAQGLEEQRPLQAGLDGGSGASLFDGTRDGGALALSAIWICVPCGPLGATRK